MKNQGEDKGNTIIKRIPSINNRGEKVFLILNQNEADLSTLG